MTHPAIAIDDVVRVSLAEISLAKEPPYVKVIQSQPTYWQTTAAKAIVGSLVMAVAALVLSLVFWTPVFLALSGFLFCVSGSLIAVLRKSSDGEYWFPPAGPSAE